MGERQKVWTKRRLLATPAAAVVVFCVYWLWPRSLERLTGFPPELVERASLTRQFDGEPADVSGSLEELYGFSFNRPVFAGALIYEGEGYHLSLVSGSDWRHWTLTEEGFLWDGVWRYSVAGGEAALERWNGWLAEQAG